MKLLRACFSLALVLCMSGCDDPVASVNADVMRCSEFSKSKCLSSEVNGSYKVTLSKASNTCAMLYKKVDSSESIFIPGHHLTYIDNDNWRCTAATSLSFGDLAKQATMQDGELAISLNPNNPAANEYIEQTDGIVDKVAHWYRLVHGTPCRGHFSRHSVCDEVRATDTQ
ncbi:hypothetical protein ACFOLJ_25485 [Rugamonas sp. CCM 8940]|uniref:hypothetical protein n=1 Tax=Rugamonas sp. CCM 8940 TaxID=2765359 RepID=UPI0018F52FA1|nr:hypothetical protein [Rugamonas sp. CCM 8940]MBJ7310915.1 hypothetical protein [Rugamonas sp. CCM 8940]